MSTPTNPSIPGYDFGAPSSAISPLSIDDLRNLEQTAGFSTADRDLLLRHADLFCANAEAMVDSWRSVIAAQPHLAQWFLRPDGKPDDEYKARVKRRFVQWVADIATRPHDRTWLNYQEEIGLRHTPARKNITDSAHTPPLVPLRYLLGFIPVVLPIRHFFSASISHPDELSRLELAWARAVLLHVTLWSRPYAREGLW